MAFDATYTGLITTLGLYINRDDVEDVIPTFITLAEGSMNRRLRSRLMESRFQNDLDDEYIVSPTDMIRPIAASFSTDGTGATLDHRLKFIDPDTLRQLKATVTTADGDLPQYYAWVGQQIQFFPAPTTDGLVVEVVYLKKITALTETETSNWVLTQYPDAYMHGAMYHAHLYLQDEASAATQKQLFDAVIDEINAGEMSAANEATLTSEAAQMNLFPRFDINTGI